MSSKIDVHAHYLDAAGEPLGSLTEALRTNTERLFPALGDLALINP